MKGKWNMGIVKMRDMKRLIGVVLMMAASMAYAAQGGRLMDRDIPAGTEAGLIQQLDLDKGLIEIDGRLMVLSPRAIEILLKTRDRWRAIREKVAIYRLKQGGDTPVVEALMIVKRPER